MPDNQTNPTVARLEPWLAILRPFHEFARLEASGGILLFLATAAALIWANSPAAASYTALFETRLGASIGPWTLAESFGHWINDGLMAVFFFLVGLEIKREFLEGELAAPRQAALPIAAAVGGMVVPAAFYALLAGGSEAAPGWGVPMATDIAFALGVLALLGSRVPVGLKVFVAALAIVDDLGAVLVIALFYTHTIDWLSLLLAIGLWAGVFIASRAGMRSLWAYFIPGCLVWLAGLLSGVHATIAGVMMAFTIPARPRLTVPQFAEENRKLLEEAGRDVPPSVAHLARDARSPLRIVEHALHPWVVFLILPLFALANAGVVLHESFAQTLEEPASLGILAGLLAGKPLGIAGAAWLAVKSGAAVLPESVGWRQIVGAGCLGGVGFTMSLFIAALAFPEGDLLSVAKVSILVASLASGVLGYAILRLRA